MLRKRLLPVFIMLLGSTARPAVAQQHAGGSLVPSFGVGVMEQIGPQLEMGLELQRRFGERFAGTIQGGTWRAIAACHNIGDSRRCPARGTSADVGVNAQAGLGSALFPYVGAGAGAISIRGWSPAVNARAGVVIGSSYGAQLHVEFRLQRIFEKAYTVSGALKAGIGVGW